jgi:hypothetical protein
MAGCRKATARALVARAVEQPAGRARHLGTLTAKSQVSWTMINPACVMAGPFLK